MVTGVSARSFTGKWFANFQCTDKATGESFEFSDGVPHLKGTNGLSFIQAVLQVTTNLDLHYLNRVGEIPGNFTIDHFTLWMSEENDDHPENPGQ